MSIGTAHKAGIILCYFKMWTSAVLLLGPVTPMPIVRIQRDLMVVPVWQDLQEMEKRVQVRKKKNKQIVLKFFFFFVLFFLFVKPKFLMTMKGGRP